MTKAWMEWSQAIFGICGLSFGQLQARMMADGSIPFVSPHNLKRVQVEISATQIPNW
jgi:hypothetical protein